MGLYKRNFIFLTIILLLLMKQKVIYSDVLFGPSIYDNYEFKWGADHHHTSSQERDVQIFLDQSSGARFESKMRYGSGFFHFQIKVPGRNSAGVVTTFYLISDSETGHDELDFEFLGNIEGQPIQLQTNVFANGVGGREQRIKLWFDPSADFHNYIIFWNEHIAAFLVDEYPVRIFMNNSNKGVGYPSQPMKIAGSIWNGDSWATGGGQTKIDWSYAPFVAGYRDFSIHACPVDEDSDMNACNSNTPYLWWNQPQFWDLNPTLQSKYHYVKGNFVTYDYCTDTTKYPAPPPECGQ